jgi:excisionase family DNA binding protein
MPKEFPEVLTVEQAAEYLGFSNNTVYQMVRDGRLPAVKIGKQWRIKKAILDKILSGQPPTEE